MLAGGQHLINQVFDAHLRNIVLPIAAHQLPKSVIPLIPYVRTHINIHTVRQKYKQTKKARIPHPPPVALVDRSNGSFRFLAARMMEGALVTSGANCEVKRGKLMAVKPP